jgi:lysophospholipase L1-like esterase
MLTAVLLGLGTETASPAAHRPACADPAPRILYLGDSLGVGTAPWLRSMLGGVPLDQDTRVGRTSSQGLRLLGLRLRRRHRVVIFDLGTNDYDARAHGRSLRLARRLSGRRQMIVFTLNKPGARPFNRAITSFASRARNVTLIDWHALGHAQRLLASDGVHADAGGYRLRAAAVARALRKPRRRFASACGPITRPASPAFPGATAPFGPPR